ncbi:hypothetical protein MCAG_03734 [Micromonospora sp. ATCC 39149]|uniref:Glycosyl transferase n=1 Tax=Micromonospora carbonacea TaxID=47853 RepID=A0A7D6C6T0_9ACTN|nr:hypothetical protein [Micromonospora sp. ATCC 39149]EEP73407.1 hypothetical protein MCAG_03734 [Micromonospora sp. ATCC 39149]QLJ99404.1 hypothetical protein HZU44_04505 [Micromonospora carbonacea]
MSSAARTAPDAAPAQALRPDVPAPAAGRWVRFRGAAARHRGDLLVGLLFTALAGWLTHGLWPDPSGRVLALNPEDQALYEWFLAVDSRALLGDFGLLTDRLNAPDGVNLMANTTVIALGVLFAPVTLLFGAPVTFAVLAGLNLAGTALAWHLLFTRVLGARRLAAALGAGLCGFGPGMVSQTNSHLHMTAQWLVPVIVWLVVRLLRAADPLGRGGSSDAGRLQSRRGEDRRGEGTGDAGSGRVGPDRRRMLTSAVGLAAVVSIQVFVGEEVLFLCALTLLVMAVTYALADRALLRRALPGFAGGILVAAGLALLVLGYPLWFQFAGPQGVADGMFSPHYFSADLSSWWTLSPLSVAGGDDAARLTTGPAEYNTFLGWPLLVVAAGCAVWLGRRPLVLACAAGALVMGALSLGPDVVVAGDRTSVPGPYALLDGLPVVDGALPMRFALAVLPLAATMLVLAVDRALRGTGRARRLVPAAVGVALLPILPVPLPTAERPTLPEFVTAGHWRECVGPGGVLVPVPLPTPKEPWPMRWATAADAEFGLPEGFFIGPYGKDGTAAMGTWKRPTSALLTDVAKRGGRPVVGEAERRQAARDAARWGASCFALAAGTRHEDDLRATLDQLYGPGERIADAWIWRT